MFSEDYEDFGLYITFHVTEKITFKVEHHVMIEKGKRIKLK